MPFMTPRYPWHPDRGDGTYANPVLCADYSDPDVIRVGPDFYLTASSFNCTPGLPILHSRDLVNWTLINHALKNVPGDQYLKPLHGCGVWAPAIRFHDKRFWIFFPTPDEGIYVTTSKDPRGEWSEPKMLLPGKGLIDPCPLWDDDGKAYLVHAYARSRAGIKHILRVRPMSPDATQILGEGQIVYNDPENQPTLEGPKFHKRNGLYYLSAPAGGVGTGWQLILRSNSPYGPYEPRKVLAQGSTPINGPHQGAIVDTPAGHWWFLHFQERLPTGRIVHLEPMRWENDWPVIGINQDKDGVGEPVPSYEKPIPIQPVATPATSDDFKTKTLGLQWQWHANHSPDWADLPGDGTLRLRARPTEFDFANVPSLLLQKWPAIAFTVETAVSLAPTSDTDRAGLIVMGLEHAALLLRREGRDFAVYFARNNAETLLSHLRADKAQFRVTVIEDATCRFSWREDDTADWNDAAGPFKATEGRWIGAKVGLFAIAAPTADGNGSATFDYFRFSPPPAPPASEPNHR